MTADNIVDLFQVKPKVTRSGVDANATQLQGYVRATRREITAKLGEPFRCGQDHNAMGRP